MDPLYVKPNILHYAILFSNESFTFISISERLFLSVLLVRHEEMSVTEQKGGINL